MWPRLGHCRGQVGGASGYTDTDPADIDTYYLQVLQEAAQHSHQGVTRKTIKCPESMKTVLQFYIVIDIKLF